MKRTPTSRILRGLTSGLLLLPVACTGTGGSPEAAVREGLNDNFLSAELDVDSYVARFEVESREVCALRVEILEAIGLEPGESVADIGAGTGLFLEPFSAAVGDSGTVYAVDISPQFIDHLEERAKEEGYSNVEVVLCDERDSRLPANSVDAIFVCDTYHHFTYPQTTLASLRRALRPGGRMIIVDFERIEGVSSEWILGHVRAGKEVFLAEIEEAGFVLEDEPDIGLVDNYMLRFGRGND